jgi:hypothetical protein
MPFLETAVGSPTERSCWDDTKGPKAQASPPKCDFITVNEMDSKNWFHILSCNQVRSGDQLDSRREDLESIGELTNANTVFQTQEGVVVHHEDKSDWGAPGETRVGRNPEIHNT